jgi:hypothetical protein
MTEVLAIDGSANALSQSFVVRPGWQIQWQTEGSTFQFSVSGDMNLGKVIDQAGPASGVTSVPVGGSFTIEVKAKGPWTIVVRQPG